MNHSVNCKKKKGWTMPCNLFHVLKYFGHVLGYTSLLQCFSKQWRTGRVPPLLCSTGKTNFSCCKMNPLGVYMRKYMHYALFVKHNKTKWMHPMHVSICTCVRTHTKEQNQKPIGGGGTQPAGPSFAIFDTCQNNKVYMFCSIARGSKAASFARVQVLQHNL